MTRSDGSRDPARRLAGLNGRPRPGPGLLTVPAPPPPAAPPTAAPPTAMPPTAPRPPFPAASDPPTVPLPLPPRARRTGPAPGAPRWRPPPPERRDAGPDPAEPGYPADPAPPDPGGLDDAPDPGTHGARPPAWRRVALRWLPPSLAGARVDPGRPGALALVVVVLVGALVAGAGVWGNRPTARPVDGPAEITVGAGPPGPPVPSAPASTEPLVVSVVGRVARPGLVRVPDGSRVADALDAAGGALPGVDLTVLNLARRLGDGEQVAIGVPPAADAAPVLPAPGAEPASGGEPGSGGGSAAGGAPGAKVDLNAATVADLDALPGIGPVTAAKILDWRTRNGRFSRVEQLREVDGIGEGRFAKLKDLVSV